MSSITSMAPDFNVQSLASPETLLPTRHFTRAVTPQPLPQRDLVAEALRYLELTDWRAGMTTLKPRFALEAPSGCVGFYAIRSGHCWLKLPDQTTPIRLSPNEFVVVAPQGSHLLYDQDPAGQVSVKSLYDLSDQPPFGSTPSADGVQILHAHFSDLDLGRTAFHGVLPPFIAKRPEQCSTLRSGAALVECIVEERVASRRGWRTIVERLTHILFLKTLQGFLLEQPEASLVTSQGNWLRAACDPVMGPVLGLIHRHPEEPWTVRQLATHSNMAKSAFSEQFHRAVGKPPLQYVTEFRMRRACEMLRATELDIKQIAARVGYESASSFSNAFKRLVKSSPAGFRRQSSTDNSTDD